MSALSCLWRIVKSYKRGVSEAVFTQRLSLSTSDVRTSRKTNFDELGLFYGGLSGKCKDDFEKGTKQYVTYMNVFKNPLANQQANEYVSVNSTEKQNRVSYGDILFTQSSETLEEVGYSSVWLYHDRPYLNSFCFGFHFYNLSEINPIYFAYYMRSGSMRKAIMREGQGATRINLSAERMKCIELILPSTLEQNAIADFLFALDKRIQSESRIMDLLIQAKGGYMQKMFI